jgi:hypothetical protein
MEVSVFWDVMPRNSIHDVWCLPHAGFLLGLLLDSEDGGDMFLRNDCLLSADCMALYASR